MFLKFVIKPSALSATQKDAHIIHLASTVLILAYEVGLGFIWIYDQYVILSIMNRDLTNLPLATGEGDVYETAGVCDSLLCATLGGLLLLLRLNLFARQSAL